MFCGKCGNKLNDGDLFCGKCGAKTIQDTKQSVVKKTESAKIKSTYKPMKIKIPKVKFTEVIPPMFEWTRDFGEGLAMIQDIGDSGQTSVLGFIDTKGNMVIE